MHILPLKTDDRSLFFIMWDHWYNYPPSFAKALPVLTVGGSSKQHLPTLPNTRYIQANDLLKARWDSWVPQRMYSGPHNELLILEPALK